MDHAPDRKSPLIVCTAAMIVVSLGCTPANELGTVPVAGKVTYKGEPVEGATVSFLGEGNERPATGVSDAEGAYKLMTLSYDGAMPGKYTVLVEKIENSPEAAKVESMEEAAKRGNQALPKAKRLLPAKYADAAASPLKFEVKAGQTNAIDLQLAD